MKQVRHHVNFIIIGFFSVSMVLFIISICYAQGDGKPITGVPEPTTLALLSSTGFLGWLLRFARKRFHEFKRFFDLLAGAFGLVIAAPILAFTALYIKIVSPGPVFFTQERVGKGGRVFKIFKIRTMNIDAEKNTGPVWAQENDPRLIKGGKIIRKAHIDEIPQLFNVLKGEMSLIGPRPERPIFVEKLSREVMDYKKRLRVKPGITGLAQIWHKYDETIQDVKKKVKYDLLYIRKMCLWVDIRILFQTIIASVLGKGAR
jgi:lipopolysaccharide/colanic/teichoic acid biosynthesis glycosyltransferase